MRGFSKSKPSQNTPSEMRTKVESQGGSNGAIPSNKGDPMNDKDYALFKQNKHRTIFLRDLPFHFRDNHLRELVLPLVENNNNVVELCRVKYSMKHGKTLQVGIVMFQDDEHAKQVLEKLQAFPRCCGRDVRVSFFEPNTENEQSQNGELNFKFECNASEPLITEETIRQDLEVTYGTLSSVCIRGHYYPSGGSQNGFGFVTFSNCEDNIHDMLASRDESWIAPNGIKYEFNRIKPTKASFSPSTVQGANTGNNGRFPQHSTNHSNQRANNILPNRNYQSSHNRSANYKGRDPNAPNQSLNAPYHHNGLKSVSSSTFNDVRASYSPNADYRSNKYTSHDGFNYHVVAVEIPANQMYPSYNVIPSASDTSYFHHQIPYHAHGHHLAHDNNNLHTHWQQGQQPAPHVMINMNAPNNPSSVITPSLPNQHSQDIRLRLSNLPPAISTATHQSMYDSSGTSPMALGTSSFSGSLSPSPTAMSTGHNLSSASSGSLQSYPSPYGHTPPHLAPHNGTAVPLGVPQTILWQPASISSPLHQLHPHQPPQQRQQHVYPYMAQPLSHHAGNSVIYTSGSSNNSPRLATMNMYSQLSRSHSSSGSNNQSDATNQHQNLCRQESIVYDATASSNAS